MVNLQIRKSFKALVCIGLVIRHISPHTMYTCTSKHSTVKVKQLDVITISIETGHQESSSKVVASVMPNGIY